MADLDEIYGVLFGGADGSATLKRRASICVLMVADQIRTRQDNKAPFSQTKGMHTKRVMWAKEAYQYPFEMAERMLPGMVMVYEGASVGALVDLDKEHIIQAIAEVVDFYCENSCVSYHPEVKRIMLAPGCRLVMRGEATQSNSAVMGVG